MTSRRENRYQETEQKEWGETKQTDGLKPTDPIPNQLWHYMGIQDGGTTDDSTTSIFFRIFYDSTSRQHSFCRFQHISVFTHKDARWWIIHIAHLWQECHNSIFVLFQEKLLMILKCYNFLGVQRWHICPPEANFANCVMTQYMLKVLLQTFLSIPITQKCQILSCDTLVANEWCFVSLSNWSHLSHLVTFHITFPFFNWCPTPSLMTCSVQFSK
jgi:hypothetical protein